jgi:hypothetical protein
LRLGAFFSVPALVSVQVSSFFACGVGGWECERQHTGHEGSFASMETRFLRQARMDQDITGLQAGYALFLFLSMDIGVLNGGVGVHSQVGVQYTECVGR